MNKIREKFMQTNFTKALKRLIIASLCVVILGGGVSAFLLRTQIGEAVTYVQQEEKNGNEYARPKEDGTGHGENGENRERYDKEYTNLENTITSPSTAAKAAVGITGMLCFLIGIGFWLLVAAWLYQAAVLAGMHGFLWFLLGLGGNVLAAVLFLLVRSMIRQKCKACGSYQPVKAQYCTKCGEALSKKCLQCGAVCGKDDKFCHSCGKSFEQE